MSEPTSAPRSDAEEPAPYGSGPTTSSDVKRVRTHHLAQWKQQGHKWAMLTAYDQYMAATFDEAGIPVFLVGDS
ncbi:MAG: 3-methyl-2-oxobutanoate hydroxymethyltransferase, partial [Actinomycetales bacterium]